MTFLYALAVNLVNLLVPLFPFINRKAALWAEGRKGWKKKLDEKFPAGKKIAWFHAASLGEFEQGKPLIEEIRQKRPDYFILVTFFSPSGYEVRKNYKHADCITYLPLDTPANARYFINKVNPSVAFFIKYEFWYFFLMELKRKNIPVYLVSGIFRPGQVFFRWYGSWFRKQLRNFTFFFLQNEDSESLLEKAGLDNCMVSGDTRFDTVSKAAASSMPLEIVEAFTAGKKCFVAGSTWPEDEEILAWFINNSGDGVKFIITPHEISERHIRQLTSLLQKDSILYSESTPENVKNKKVLIIDNVGMLLRVYGYASMAYVGGGFGRGIHNILEPAAFGAPVIIGPNYGKFREAVDLVKLGGAFTVSNGTGLNYAYNKVMNDPATYSSIVRKYVESNTKATDIIMKNIHLQ